jgi:tetratricopeptide (TPR) repeat protein
LLRALRLLGPHRAKPTLDHLVLWNRIGMVYKYLGQFGEARKYYRAALRWCEACLTGSDRYDAVASLYHNLGGIEHSLRRFRRGEKYARAAVRWRLRMRPRDVLAIAGDRVALAAILDGLGKFGESEKIYLAAWKIYRQAFGAVHQEIAVVLNNLAAVYQKTGRTVRAEKMYRAALAMKIETLGGQHPDVGVTMNNLAMLLAAEGRLTGARRYFEKAHRLLAKTLGAKHPNTRAVRTSLDGLRHG